MSVLTLESSRSTADKIISNAEWETSYSIPYVIENGDVFQLKNALIDSGKNDIQDIILDDDLEIVMHLGYYVMNYTQVDKYNNANPSVAYPVASLNYKPYIPYFMSTHGTDKYGDLAGLYVFCKENDVNIYKLPSTESYIFKFTCINELGQVESPEYIAKTQIVSPDPTGSGPSAQYPWKLKITFDKPTKDIEISSLTILTPFTPENTDNYYFIFDEYIWENKHDGKAPGAGNHPGTMVTSTFKTTIPAGSYSYQNLAHYITDKMDTRGKLTGDADVDSNNPFLQKSDQDGDVKFLLASDGTPDPTTGNLPNPYLPLAPGGDNNLFSYSDGTNKIPYWFGSTQNSLQYNLDNERDIFSFDYFHTPLKDSTGNQITLDIENTNKWYSVNKASGCFLLGLYPTDFWQDKLGFDLKSIIVTPEIVTAQNNCQIVRDSMLIDSKTITGNYLNLDGLINNPTGNNLFAMKNAIKTPNPIQSNITYSINANNINSKSNSGAYLIEVSGIPQTYLYNDDINSNISGIVSKQYNSSSLIVGFSDSAISYQHIGHAISLQTIKIRILDILTKQPAQDLGENSTLIFNVFKNPGNEDEKKKLKSK